MQHLLGVEMYGILIAGAIVLCIGLSWYLLKKRGYNSDIVFDVAIICIPLAIIGARVYYIIFSVIGGETTLAYWFTDLRFLGFERGENGKLDFLGLKGLAIFGGLIFATAGGAIVARIHRNKEPSKRMTFFQLVDMFYIFIILGQAIGRWGNYFNQEAYGAVTDCRQFPFAVFIEDTGMYHQATFFYEFFFNLIGFALLAWLYFGRRRSYDGFNFSVYCIWYGTVRAVIEGMRSDSLMMGSLRVSQWLAAILIVYGLGNIAYHIYGAKKSGKKVFIFVDKDALSLDYYGYEKTIMYINSQRQGQAEPVQDAEGAEGGHAQEQDNQG